MPRNRCYSSVVIVHVPDDFKPEKPFWIPDKFSDGEIYVKRLEHASAQGFVLTFNKRQLNKWKLCDGIPDRRWAIAIVSNPRPGCGALRHVLEEYDRTILDMKAIAWWDRLSADERQAMLEATGEEEAGIADAFRLYLRSVATAAGDARDEAGELPSNDAA
jgi:hypothetical protein